MRIFLLVLVGFLSLNFTLFSFFKSKFTGDPESYISELKDYMKNVSDMHEEVVDRFVNAWEEDSLFNDKVREDILQLSQKLDKKNARPYPHFVDFLKLMLIFQENNISDEHYNNWVDGFGFYLSRKRANSGELKQILSFSVGFFGENILYQSTSTKWRATSLDYKVNSKKGIFIEYAGTELVCYTRTDSINLFETKGYLNPSENKWYGNGGIVTWERGGYSREQINARLKEYIIELRKSEYEANNVTFTNTIYFDEPILGEIKDKVKHIGKPEDATYPKFFSYEKTFEIEDLYKDVNYSGGLSMQGAKLVGQGNRANPARIYLFRRDTLVLEATSLYFGFKADRVSSQKTAISIKLKQDSIYHPDLFFTFRIANRELTLLKTENFTSLGPYYNSYHNIDMNFDRLIWRIDEDYMRFTAPRGTTVGKAYFESENYFNFKKFEALQMADWEHPLVKMKRFSKRYGREDFPIRDYADYLQQPLTTVKHQVMRLAFGGFVFYDDNTEMISIKPRLHDYMAASINKIDYDVMAFESSVEAPLENAIFNLRNYDLTVHGIPRIFVSDSQNVVIYPKNSRIIMKENRNFQFDGTVTAGLLTFFGKNLFFHYDSFKVTLQNVDSVDIDYQTGSLDNFGLPEIGNVKNLLQNVTGDILVDKPDNKSGRIGYPEYPIFRSKEVSYVYYEASNIQGGVYDANDFYFAVDTFQMDSLDNFNAYAMQFNGEFVSAGILPEMRKSLYLQEDNSLGFEFDAPEEGVPLFGGKGVFNNQISLSNNGLRGSGSVDYLTSTTWSDDFRFFPDSMNTHSQKFQIRKSTTDTQYPSTRSVNNRIHWEPYNDVMWSYRTDSLFTMFNDSTRLEGDLQLEPTGLSGWGRMDLRNSDLYSDWFTYQADDIYADTSDFYLKSLQAEGFTVLTENVNSHISYTQRKAWFKSNEEFSLVTFPENKYISYIDYFMWDMMGKTLAMGSKSEPEIPDYTHEDIEPEGPRFISTDKQQDSLNFVSPLAYYDYENNFINATGVKFIEVADARVYPKEGFVTVQPNYKIKTLVDSRIRANKTSKFHTLHTATININGRKDYTGLANYNYVDENEDIQLIHFSEVKVDTGGQTVAEGEIFETADFTLSPVYKYQGKVNLFANDSLLFFKGVTQIEHACDKITPEWLKFETRIDPSDIYIPIEAEARNNNNERVFAGMFMYYDSVHVYPALINRRKNYSDQQIITPSGYLHYDRASQRFKIGSKEKINDFRLAENYVSFHREDCQLNGEGEINLGQDLGLVTLKNYGSIIHKVDENKTELNLVMAINFYITPEMLNVVGNEIDSFPRLQAVSFTRDEYKKAMNAWVGEETYKKFEEELTLFGTVKEVPKPLLNTILINEIKLTWSDVTNSFHSVGQIGIASINGIQINKKIDGFFELRIKRSGDIMDLYLQLDRRNYYYFGYTRGVMQTLSSNRTYVETIMNMKTKDRKVKTNRGQTPYNFLISTDRKKNNFYRRWQDILNPDEGGDF